ncbi:MAG: hypothetical protein Q9214_001786 [Letrouitia sp. 1 TL-2023]
MSATSVTTRASDTGDRRYHNSTSAYVLPNDAVELERLDAQATAIVEMIGGATCLTPMEFLRGASKAVDVGCGTGVATVQIASLLPSVCVYGLDISPVSEDVRKTAPSNVKWAVGNVLDFAFSESHKNSSHGENGKFGGDNEPTDDFEPSQDSKSGSNVPSSDIFVSARLDYIYGRMLFLGISDWARYFSIASYSLKSGGIIEHQDLDWKFYRVGTSECISDNWPWHQAVVSAAEQSGLSTRAGSDAAKLMRGFGLEIVSVQTFEFSFVPSRKVPNSQAMGKYVQAKLLPQYPELLRKMLGCQSITGSDLQELTENCLRDISSEEGVHQKYTVTIARKP